MSRRLALSAVSIVAAFVLCSCGDADDPSGPETTSSPSSPEATESQAEPGSEGVVAEVDGAQLTAPDGWTVVMEDGSPVIGAPKDAGGYSPGFGVFDADMTLLANTDELAATALKVLKGSRPDAKRLPDVEFGGVTFYHLRSTNDVNSYDEYGSVIGDSEASVAWTFLNDFASREQIDEMINQVMPTFKFEG
ncbi:hypothetical protein GCM10007979_23870 [Nocardioides albus]|nr:hypothetical protein GCM10007979_23870 [Nocardioides albus]